MPPNTVKNSICVIGGGIIGSWTSLHLARAGLPTVLIEQFPFSHTRGSSSGGSRSFRFLGDDDFNVLKYSLNEWLEMGKKIGSDLFIKTGLLSFGTSDDSYLLECMEALKKGGYPAQWLNASDIQEQYPMIKYPANWGAVYDPNGGLLIAHKCVEAVQREFVSLGGKILQAKAENLSSDENLSTVQVRLSTGERQVYQFQKAVVCAGPWTAKLLPALKPYLETEHISVLYWHDKTHKQSNGTQDSMAASSGFPIIYNARLTNVYSIPSYEYPGLVKVLYHGGPVADPDLRDQVDATRYIEYVSKYVKEHFPKLEHKSPAISEQCLYTVTKDRQPIIDRFGKNIIVGAGFSGSGFKHSPATGKMLAYIAMDKEKELPGGFGLTQYAFGRKFEKVE